MDKFIFGITGPTGAGKSTVSDIFRRLGVYVADADIAARAVMKKGEKCLQDIYSAFGKDVFTDEMELNRAALAKIVFNDTAKLRLLNEISHKYIKQYIECEINESHAEFVAIDGAVIIGSPVMDMCRLLVVVSADEDTRIKRIIERDKINYESASQRINSQMQGSEYEHFADFVIKNNDTSVRLEECVEEIYSKIKNISTSTSTKATSS